MTPEPDVSQLLRATVEPAGGEITPESGGLTFEVQIFNVSSIVDGFVVEARQAPTWLQLTAGELRLMPDSNDISRVTLRCVPGVVPPAGRFRLWLQVRSVASPSVLVTLPVDLSVPVISAPLTLKLEPSVVRVRGTGSAAFVAVIDNSGGNQVRRVVLGGEDPERQVRFQFSPPAVDVPPGGTAHVRIRMDAPAPEPGREISRQVTVLITDPVRPVTTVGTMIQTTEAAPVDVPYEVELAPSLIRIRDVGAASVRVVIDNKEGVRARRVTLTGTDPEGVLRFSFRPAVVEVGRGMEATAEARIEVRPPAPGAEATHPFTVTGWDGNKEVAASGTVVASTTPPPEDRPLTLRVDPSVLRVKDSLHAETTLFVDNRAGAYGRLVQFGGFDPERVLGFSFTPDRLELGPGQAATVRVRVSGPRGGRGTQATHPFTLVAADGANDVEISASLVQEFSDHRPIWRRTLTVLGALLMAVAAFLPWNVGAAIGIPPEVGVPVSPDVTGLEWGMPAIDSVATASGNQLFLPDLPNAVDPVVSAGAILIVLAALAMLGLMGSTGRLTRLTTLIAAVALAAFLIVVSLVDGTGSVGVGAILAFGGCVIGFVGGALAKR